jgi:hypothetical protein
MERDMMNVMRRLASLGLSLVATWLVAGCGPSKTPGVPDLPPSTSALTEVGEMYRLYELRSKKPPTKVQDFQNLNSVCPIGYLKLSNGEVVAQWGVMLTGLGEGESSGDSGDEVLAYEKDVPEKGGQVLMKDRTVKTMTPEQFKAAPKAGGSK